MRRKRRLHKPELKAKVALTAIKGEMTMAEMVKKFDVQAAQITQWKKQLLGNAGDVFDGSEKEAEGTEKTVQELHAKIGQLTMENDFLERGLVRIHGPRGKNWWAFRRSYQCPDSVSCWTFPVRLTITLRSLSATRN